MLLHRIPTISLFNNVLNEVMKQDDLSGFLLFKQSSFEWFIAENLFKLTKKFFVLGPLAIDFTIYYVVLYTSIVCVLDLLLWGA